MNPNIILRARFFVAQEGSVTERASALGAYSPLRRIVMRRAKYRCEYCGVRVNLVPHRAGPRGSQWWMDYTDPRWSRKAEIEHRLPRSRGGQNTTENLALSCFGCNRRKHTTAQHEWAPVILLHQHQREAV